MATVQRQRALEQPPSPMLATSESSTSDSDTSEGGSIMGPPPGPMDIALSDDDVASGVNVDPGGSSPSKSLDITSDRLILFVRRLAREAARPLTQAEIDWAQLIIEIRKKWASANSVVRQAPSRKRRSLAIAEIVAQSEEQQPKKRRMPSRTSPVLDAMPEPRADVTVYKGSVLQALPLRRKIDGLLQSVSGFFHQPIKNGVPNGMEHYIVPGQDRLHYSTLDALLSPLRKKSIWESWSPGQLAIFEAGICTLGKNFHEIAKLIENKTTGDIVNMYYHWKQSGHYEMWKAMGKPIAINTPSHQAPPGSKLPGKKGAVVSKS